MRKVLAILFGAATLITLGCQETSFGTQIWNLLIGAVGGGQVRVDPLYIDRPLESGESSITLLNYSPTFCAEAECPFTFDDLAIIELVVVPDDQFKFVEWTDCSPSSTRFVGNYELKLNADKRCIATFGPAGESAPLAVQVQDGGVVSTMPDLITNCSDNCTQSFPLNTVVTLTAVANSGWSFHEWGGNCAGNSAQTTVMIDAAKSCTASFKALSTFDVLVHARALSMNLDPPIVAPRQQFEMFVRVLNPDDSATYSFAWDPFVGENIASFDVDEVSQLAHGEQRVTAALFGSYDFRVVVTDQYGNSGEATISVQVDHSLSEDLVVKVAHDGVRPSLAGEVYRYNATNPAGTPIGAAVMRQRRSVSKYEWMFIYEGATPNDTPNLICDPMMGSQCLTFEGEDAAGRDEITIDLAAGAWRVLVKVTDVGSDPPTRTAESTNSLRFELH